MKKEPEPGDLVMTITGSTLILRDSMHENKHGWHGEYTYRIERHEVMMIVASWLGHMCLDTLCLTTKGAGWISDTFLREIE